jgi:hypothetical protein
VNGTGRSPEHAKGAKGLLLHLRELAMTVAVDDLRTLLSALDGRISTLLVRL